MTHQSFLPVTAQEAQQRGWSSCDFVFVTGDAYVDHSSFAAALLGRLLEAEGYSVGIIAQPDWKSADSFKVFGRPRLGFLVSAGAMDSMVSNYTANNKPRSEDAYAHGGMKGCRPDRALITYTAKIREAYKGVLVIIGGIEASLRRFTHFDYWSATVKRSILLDSKADLLIYGMGERPILEAASRLKKAAKSLDKQYIYNTPENSAKPYVFDAALLRGIRGTCWRTGKAQDIPIAENDSTPTEEKDRAPYGTSDCQTKAPAGPCAAADCKTQGTSGSPVFLPSFEEISKPDSESKQRFAQSYIIQEQNTDPVSARVLIEQSDTRYVVQEPPAHPLTQQEFDRVMELPFTRTYHPMYDKPAANGKTGVPALQEVLFSLTHCRGCFGACSFCAITFHQGKRIQTRSEESLVREAQTLINHPDFKGYIHDVGGPSANFRQNACTKQEKFGACIDRECLGTDPCPNLNVDHSGYISLLRRLRSLPGVKKVFVRSGIRFDYLMLDKDKTFFEELCMHHISGQLKVAPEHVSNKVLSLIRKSTHEVYEQFAEEFKKINFKIGKKQYLVPYYIAGLPGADLNDAVQTALYLKKTGFVPDQVQDFYPTPGNLATCMYYTGLNPHKKDSNGLFEQIYVPSGGHERRLQRALLQFNRTENRQLVAEALEKAGRPELISVLR